MQFKWGLFQYRAHAWSFLLDLAVPTFQDNFVPANSRFDQADMTVTSGGESEYFFLFGFQISLVNFVLKKSTALRIRNHNNLTL